MGKKGYAYREFKEAMTVYEFICPVCKATYLKDDPGLTKCPRKACGADMRLEATIESITPENIADLWQHGDW